jgi:glycosyltransferase involved in cell wall biosynthesis
MSIVIATYNSAAALPSLLDSLPAGRKGSKRFETIVVNNDPDERRVIRRGRNASYAAAINAGAATAGPVADLLVLNPDIRLLPGAASLLVDRLRDSRDSPVGVAVPRELAKDGSTAGRYDGSPPS